VEDLVYVGETPFEVVVGQDQAAREVGMILVKMQKPGCRGSVFTSKCREANGLVGGNLAEVGEM
jgi:hypothetical protein